MIEIREENIKSDQLKPYIESYGLMKISNVPIQEKELLSWPGTSWLFVNQPFSINNEQFEFSSILGLREKPATFKWTKNDLEVLAVKFKPYGLSVFTNFPMEKIKDKALHYENVWTESNAMHTLRSTLLGTNPIDEKIDHIEGFLLSVLQSKSSIDQYIFRFIDQIQSSPSTDINELKQQVPLSSRQFERKFKQAVGTNLMTFVRICRFYQTKMALLQNNTDSLTALGYHSGYFDQAHFSKEFRRFSSSSPKDFPKGFPIFNLIADEKLKSS